MDHILNTHLIVKSLLKAVYFIFLLLFFFFLYCHPVVCTFFFFSSRRRHTRSLRDWSSDVCSSDLRALQGEVPVSRASSVDPVLAGIDRHHARPAADRRAGSPVAVGALGTGLRRLAVGGVLRRLRGAASARHGGGRGALLRLFHARPVIPGAAVGRARGGQASRLFAQQRVGEVLPGGPHDKPNVVRACNRLSSSPASTSSMRWSMP